MIFSLFKMENQHKMSSQLNCSQHQSGFAVFLADN